MVDPRTPTLAALGLLAALAAAPGARAQQAPTPPAAAAQAAEIRLGLIYRPAPAPSSYDAQAAPEDEGLAGARLAIQDNATTGRFVRQSYALDAMALRPAAPGEPPPQSATDAARDLAARGLRFLVLALPADEVLAVADALKGSGVMLFNASAPDDRLRGAECRADLFHVAPSRAMQTDALAQFLAFMRWRKLFLITGPQEGDKLWAEAMKRSAKKFGLQLAAERPWTFGPLARARGDTPTRAEALVFTRGLDYDVAVVADEAGDFGDYVPFHTVDPRPVVGTQGLIPTTWHPTLEVWGAAQAQNRFRRLAGRLMRPLDYQVWAAMRAVGEAAFQKKTTDPAALAAAIADPAFTLPGYKGVALSFRPWDHQLRQPLLLVQPQALVAVAPEQGYLHQRTPLDTLGIDLPETQCRLTKS
ncbi:ABC transporter substrate-binding protein [Methylobacterium variabile]|jgi:ABC transporter substrate binding protein (PQQ-dependent alcohol dehydrogenase system)|uniref:ABC transporter substrate-binding protein n=1 Tax=Methylobacterium variabile TaxID=298794 RepID=A0A0J6SUL6_9HYPH|nr:ABC transporter substrate-binding protein [Methylobacterium variabile]KMO37419.1 ABC transporter substrate-binding protein [Methylobacterium variabile]